MWGCDSKACEPGFRAGFEVPCSHSIDLLGYSPATRLRCVGIGTMLDEVFQIVELILHWQFSANDTWSLILHSWRLLFWSVKFGRVHLHEPFPLYLKCVNAYQWSNKVHHLGKRETSYLWPLFMHTPSQISQISLSLNERVENGGLERGGSCAALFNVANHHLSHK